MGSIQNHIVFWLTKAVLNKSTIVFEGRLENILAKFGDPIAVGNVELKQIRSKDKLLRQVHHENQLDQLFQMCYVSSPELRELHELGA